MPRTFQQITEELSRLDDETLDELKNWLDDVTLTADELAELNRRNDEIKSGHFHTHEEVMRILKKYRTA